MLPFFAQGAAQAIEDAVVLAGCLAANTSDPAAALNRYEQIRRPRATRLQLLSRGRHRTNNVPGGPEQQARDVSFAREDPLTQNGWIFGYDAENGLASAPA
jgi:salicylate hydroxylase